MNANWQEITDEDRKAPKPKVIFGRRTELTIATRRVVTEARANLKNHRNAMKSANKGERNTCL